MPANNDSKEQDRFRLIVLAAALGWFVYWGNGALVSMTQRDKADVQVAKSVRSEDWNSAQHSQQQRNLANEALIRCVGWGLALPLVLLVAFELKAGHARLSRHD
jgi:hypothetical protein